MTNKTRLKLNLVWIINKYVNWSCDLNAKLIKLQRRILDDVKVAVKWPTEEKENG